MLEFAERLPPPAALRRATALPSAIAEAQLRRSYLKTAADGGLCSPASGRGEDPHARRVSSAIRSASPASTVPISQRCTSSQVGRVPRNSAIEPAASAIPALTLTLITIWIDPSASDCVSTLP